MSEDDMLKCLIAFVLGFLVSRMFRGNGLAIGGQIEHDPRTHLCNNDDDCSDGGQYSKCMYGICQFDY
jgi:hypothetical protein